MSNNLKMPSLKLIQLSETQIPHQAAYDPQSAKENIDPSDCQKHPFMKQTKLLSLPTDTTLQASRHQTSLHLITSKSITSDMP